MNSTGGVFCGGEKVELDAIGELLVADAAAVLGEGAVVTVVEAVVRVGVCVVLQMALRGMTILEVWVAVAAAGG